jgi:two-component system sensor histidine kinase CiaH
MFQRVRVRITILTVLAVLCLYIVSSLSVYSIVRHAVIKNADYQLSQVIQSISKGDPIKVMNGLPHGTYLLIKRRKRVITNMPTGMQRVISQITDVPASSHRFSTNWTSQTYRQIVRILYVPVKKIKGVRSSITVAMNITRETSVLQQLRHVFLIVGAVGSLLAAIVGFILARRVLKPIRLAWQRQLEFVADASHELRTPLAVIQSNLGIVLEHTNETVLENLEWIHNAHGESRRLGKLVGDLLTLARTDAEVAPIQQDEVDISEISSRVAELFQPVVMANEQHLHVRIEPEIKVTGDNDRLQQLLIILMDNACKYTPTAETIQLTVQTEANQCLLIVKDTGIGIDGKDLSRIFDRFYQADAARARTTQHGAGLGLSIAKWIVDAHHGKIDVKSEVEKGTEFTVSLPLRG